MVAEPFTVARTDRVALHGERAGRGTGPVVVLLHANVADRRAYRDVVRLLDGDGLDLIAYDRRGFGETPFDREDEGFTHLADLVALLDDQGVDRAVLVGNSMGGALALDLAATAPDRVASVLLLSGGVSGMTDEGEETPYELDPATAQVFGALERAEQDGDIGEQVRLELHLWLDGPAQPEGRVQGEARELAAAMNRRVLDIGAPDSAGDSGLDTWHALGSVRVPVVAAWGALDVPADLPWYERIAEGLGDAVPRVLPDSAHLPSLDAPEVVAELIRETVRRSDHPKAN
ncbi:alpha/beta hydrolase [Amnibacterium sp. CER49]|uniref:alpha/beta fold hydrolase n=1 Tax=Amnibacterium sp. CER49 TaxID=3039161 RepID=UPI002446A42C|nr:alpha/beta hydrolase [Amnibacterium sp. CER49]MDH2444575.1 alpha/beta hydrolase [Amnibacterium sp. CER49]